MKPYYDEAGITIYHGDCLDVLPHLGLVDVTVTSPPYNTLGSRVPASPTGMHSTSAGMLAWATKVKDHGYADDLPEVEYAARQIAIATAIRDATKAGGSFFYNHKIRYRDGVPIHPLDLVRAFEGWRLRQEIVWDRRGAVAFNARMFAPSDERIYWLTNGKGSKWNQIGAAYLTVWPIEPVHGLAGHPCPYPELIPKRCILAVTDPEDVVLDPFMGAGTTLRVAKYLNRRAIGIEIEERFCEVAANRLAQSVLDLGGVA